MKCHVIIDPDREEEVRICAHRRSPLVEEIEKLVQSERAELIGYRDKVGTRLQPEEVIYFAVEDERVIAVTTEGRFQLRCRLYQLEGRLPPSFIKLNQSCIGNVRHIRRFDASIGGTLLVTFQNGHTDTVSRRCLKAIKERLG